jgi:hypothetical protein
VPAPPKPPPEHNASSFESPELAAALQGQWAIAETEAGEALAEAHVAREQPSKGLTLELSGGAAVRLNEMLDGCDAARSGDDNCPDERNA